MKPQFLPRRDPSVSIETLASRKIREVEIDGPLISRTDVPHTLDLAARLIEGHPDDITALAAALRHPRVRAGLLADLEIDLSYLQTVEDQDDTSPAIGDAAIKILSALYAAEPTDFDGFLILSLPPISTHLKMFEQATSFEEQKRLHTKEPDLEAIIARPWQLAFHGHQHSSLMTRASVHARAIFG